MLRTARGLGGEGRATIIGDDRPASQLAAVLAAEGFAAAAEPFEAPDGGLFASYAPATPRGPSQAWGATESSSRGHSGSVRGRQRGRVLDR